jgi:hypothetical protein
MLASQAAAIRGGFFVLPSGTYVIATGPFAARALVLTARVGDVRVVAVHTSPTGGSFVGRLSGTPRPGAALFVRYPPEPEVQTRIVYQPPAPTLPVA